MTCRQGHAIDAANRIARNLRNERNRTRRKALGDAWRQQSASQVDRRRLLEGHRGRGGKGRGGVATGVRKVQSQGHAGARRPQSGKWREDQDCGVKEAYLLACQNGQGPPEPLRRTTALANLDRPQSANLGANSSWLDGAEHRRKRACRDHAAASNSPLAILVFPACC